MNSSPAKNGSPGLKSNKSFDTFEVSTKDIKEIIILEEDEEEEEKECFQTCKNSIIQITNDSLSESSHKRFFEEIAIIQKSLNDIFKVCSNEKLMKKILELINNLKILQSQHEMLKEIIDNDDAKNISLIKKKYESLGEFSIEIDSRDQINFYIIETATVYVTKNIFLELGKLIASIQKKLSEKTLLNYLNDLKIVLSKLKTIVEFFPKCVIFDKEDIFSHDKASSPVWMELAPFIQQKQLAESKKIEKEFKKIVRYILLANAIMAKESEHKHKISQVFAKGFGAIFYFFVTSRAQKKAHVFFADPHAETAQKVWNLPDSTFIKGILKMMMPTIEYNKKIFIERDNEENITDSSIGKEIEKGIINKIDEEKHKPFKVMHLNLEDYYNELFKECKDHSKICIRIICSKKLPNKPKKNNTSPNKIEEFFANLLPKPKKGDTFFSEALVIHIHGGGFISMSSRSHQTYTRKWANYLKIPIFSIDYRLAPEYPYPAALEDCWQAYNWIIRNVYDIFGYFLDLYNIN